MLSSYFYFLIEQEERKRKAGRNDVYIEFCDVSHFDRRKIYIPQAKLNEYWIKVHAKEIKYLINLLYMCFLITC